MILPTICISIPQKNENGKTQNVSCSTTKYEMVPVSSPDMGEILHAIIVKNYDFFAPYMDWVSAVPKEQFDISIVQTFVDSVIQGQAQVSASNMLACSVFAITTTATAVDHERTVIGLIGLQEINWDKKWAEVGYWIDEDYARRGIIAACFQELEQWAIQIGLKKLCIKCVPDNIGSIRVAEKFGFTPIDSNEACLHFEKSIC